MAQRKKYRTARGLTFDMDQFVQANNDAVAAGKMAGQNVNARGDILGKGGIVVKPREKVVREYYRQELPKVKEQSIKEEIVEKPTPTQLATATPIRVEEVEVFDSPAAALEKIQKELEASKVVETTTKKKTTKKSK